MIKNLFLRSRNINSEHLNFGKNYLSGFLGAITVLLIIQIFQAPPQRLGTVNITGMVDQFVKEESNRSISQDQIKKEVTAFGHQLEKEFTEYSKDHRIVLLPSEAVIAGGVDYTKIIAKRLTKFKSEEDK